MHPPAIFGITFSPRTDFAAEFTEIHAKVRPINLYKSFNGYLGSLHEPIAVHGFNIDRGSAD